MSGPFPIVDATGWTPRDTEQLGSKAKVWLESPDGTEWLFKQVRSDPNGVRGEDWAEKLGAEMAQQLRLPAAEVELAYRPFIRGEPRGVISRSILRDGDQLTHGNDLLSGQAADYPRSKTGEVAGYTVDACMQFLVDFAPTPGSDAPDGADARFLFAGYLLLDALIANTDRHHENWAVIQRPGEPTSIAPTFDHGACLGFAEPAARKAELLESQRIAAWTANARTKFEGKPHPRFVASRALALLPGSQADVWYERLERLDLEGWSSTLDRVPTARMSQVDRRFADLIVRHNLEELRRAH